jgi:hypothetical protein
LNQFTKTLDRNKGKESHIISSSAAAVLRLLKNYTPETAQKKRERLAENAKAKAESNHHESPFILSRQRANFEGPHPPT